MISERLYLPTDNNIPELKRQLQSAWLPMAQILNSFIKLYIQDTMPTIPNNYTCLWIDNTNPGSLKYYLVVNFGGVQKSIDMELLGYFKLDQTTPQTISGGAPIFSDGIGVTDLVDINGNIRFNNSIADTTSNGVIISATVDTNAEGIGAPLFIAADGHFNTSDASTDATAPCTAMALETGTGIKNILLYGVIRNDTWSWTIGPGKDSLIYLSTTVGTLTQTQPSGTDEVIQIVGWALSAVSMFFCPQLNYITHA